MSLKAALFQYLTSQSVVTDLVGTRIKKVHAKSSVRLPRVIYTLISEGRRRTLTVGSGVVRARVQFDSYASTPKVADSIADALRQTMDGFRGTMGSLFIPHAFLEDSEDGYEPSAHAKDVDVFRVRSDFIIHYRETAPDLIQ